MMSPLNWSRTSAILICCILCLSLSQFLKGQALIPKPTELRKSDSEFEFRSGQTIQFSSGLQMEAAYLAKEIESWTGIKIETSPDTNSSSEISLTLQDKDKAKPGSYSLSVTRTGVSIIAKDNPGIFNGIQSLLQLISINEPFRVAGVEISDEARFEWRGMMLDSSRHFQSVSEVKDFIDMMARYKFNKFHWHLTDDQGWRIQIDSFPKLTEIGAWRVPREGIWWFRPGPKEGELASYGGYYSKEEIREIIEFARQRHIEIIPEIDVPGHSLATLAAYPELSITGGPFQVNPGSKFWNIIENTLDPSREKTYEFLDAVFKEVVELFPSEYIHVGGDEATKKFWEEDERVQTFMASKGFENGEELQSYFIKRVEGILTRYDKKLIGWDEIMEGGLAENATVMSWRGKVGGIKAAELGHDVIMSPAPEYYLDVLQGDPSIEPATYSMSRLKDTYLFDATLPPNLDQSKLLGLQGNLWTEEVPNQRHAQYMIWPRAFAISEAAWSNDQSKDWPDFVERVETHFNRFDKMQVNYSTAYLYPSFSISESEDGQKTITMEHEIEGLTTYYTFDDTEPDHFYPAYSSPLIVPIGAYAIRTRTYRNGKSVGRVTYSEIHRIGKGKRVPNEFE